MKKLLLGCAVAACVFSTQVASAQDYCCPSNYCCDDTVGFEGLYLGGNIGVFSHTAHRNDLGGFVRTGDATGFSTINTNVTLGLQLGYDWLCNYKLFGLVADWNWARTRHHNDFSDDVDFFDNNSHHRFNWFTTLRVRGGLAVCDALVYVTIGAAVTSLDNNWHRTLTGATVTDTDFDHTRWGWVGGVGTEVSLWCNWYLGAEVLFLQFSHRHDTLVVPGTGPGTGSFTFGHSDSSWIGRFTLNYRFGDLLCCR